MCSIFGVYERQFDVFVFGLVDEDPAAVLKTMWSDFPVFKRIAGLGCGRGAGGYKLLSRVRLRAGSVSGRRTAFG